MNPDDILAVVRSVLIDTFLDDDLEVSRETTALDVPGWIRCRTPSCCWRSRSG